MGVYPSWHYLLAFIILYKGTHSPVAGFSREVLCSRFNSCAFHKGLYSPRVHPVSTNNKSYTVTALYRTLSALYPVLCIIYVDTLCTLFTLVHLWLLGDPLLSNGQMERISLDKDAAAAVDAYVDYRRIVGEDDGGTLFTPEEYERYKKEVLPTRLRNRLFVSWTSPSGIDCKLVGPETLCFCRHRYKQHKTDFKEIPTDRPILLPCRVTGCRCISYNYVPLNGTQPIRCRCKHFADDHNEMTPYKCQKCIGCAGFHSSFTCGCTHPTYAHTMIVETKEERLARGRSVGPDVPYAAMGGLTGFNALAEGYMRLDSSGIGAPSDEILDAPSTSMDHPFLRAYGPQMDAINAGHSPDDVYGLSRFAHLPTPEERDMAYFESQYQERLKMEKAAAKGQKKIPASKGETSQVPKPSRPPKH